jgi:hypothetical protein
MSTAEQIVAALEDFVTARIVIAIERRDSQRRRVDETRAELVDLIRTLIADHRGGSEP